MSRVSPNRTRPSIAGGTRALLSDVRTLIEEARSVTATAVNAALTMLYWRVGLRINQEILKQRRADYGEKIVVTLSRQLAEEYGEGFSEKNLWRMVQFAERIPDGKIVATLSRQLGWSHFKELLPIEDDLRRDFYLELCRTERWSVRTLRAKVAGML